MLRIREWHLPAEVGIAGEEVGEGVAAVVTRQHDVYDSFRKRFDGVDEARTAFVENHDDGFARFGQFLD